MNRETTGGGGPFAANAIEMLAEVADHIAKSGAAPAGKPFIRILEMNETTTFYHFMEPFRVRFEAGYPVASDIDGTDDIHRRELPGGKAVMGTLISSNFGQGQKQFPWVIEYAKAQGFVLDSGWGGNGGWHVLEEIRAYYHDAGGPRSRIYIPVSD